MTRPGASGRGTSRHASDSPSRILITLASRRAVWKCSRPSPVFLWPGIKDWASPPEPAPRTVRSRFSKTIGKTYPANGCIHCDAMVGDFYLFDLLLNYVDYEEAGQLAERFLNDLQPGTDAT
jgi:hypothetical protein